MTSKMNGNSDGLDIPAALRRVKGEATAAPAKPTPAKPAPAKPSATKPTPATKPTKAPKGKPLTGKQQAQLRAGVKVTDKAPAAPAKPAAETPEAKLAAGKAAIKTAKAAKPVGELLKAVKAHGKKFAHKNGWDLLLKWSDADISKELAGVTSKTAAVEKMCQGRARPQGRRHPPQGRR